MDTKEKKQRAAALLRRSADPYADFMEELAKPAPKMTAYSDIELDLSDDSIEDKIKAVIDEQSRKEQIEKELADMFDDGDWMTLSGKEKLKSTAMFLECSEEEIKYGTPDIPEEIEMILSLDIGGEEFDNIDVE